MSRFFRVRRALPPIIILSGFVVGCGSSESIESYTVPRDATSRSQPTVSKDDRKYRLLGAMFPAENPVWFFKFAGTSEQVTRHEREFDALVRSVKLRPDVALVPEFAVPAGWTATGPRVSKRMGTAIRIDETLRFGEPGESLEVTITSSSGGSTVQNFVRWAGQMGNTDPSGEDFAKSTREFESLSGKGILVDLYGSNNPAGGPMMGKR